MKTTPLILPLLLYAATVSAQDAITITAKKISQSETPVAIVEAVTTDFPGAEAQAYYLLNAEEVQSDWVVTEEDNMAPGEKADRYTVSLKGSKGGYIHAFYNANGTLERMKMTAVDFVLPANIRNYISTTPAYKGYAITSDKYVKVINQKSKKETLEVSVKKGTDTKRLYFDKNGKFIKAK